METPQPLQATCTGLEFKAKNYHKRKKINLTHWFGCIRTNTVPNPNRQHQPRGCFLRVLLQMVATATTSMVHLGLLCPVPAPHHPHNGKSGSQDCCWLTLRATQRCLLQQGLHAPQTHLWEQLATGDGESALGEVALCSRRNALHDLMGFCLSDAFLS